ncbi:MAG: hypothetical protein HY692_08555 [Cyanobacteria bacterium NC_groundwater_1444_Ag_S-0.65um_54_12]|nr:hypothetical protein [Cyanobacteria bacterium NC_groundwater_1444_Ag_S-0.65um_54_12]
MDSRLKIGYLLALGCALFAIPSPSMPLFSLPGKLAWPDGWQEFMLAPAPLFIAAALLLQAVIYRSCGHSLTELVRVTRKLAALFALLTVSYGLMPEQPGGWLWHWRLGTRDLLFSVDGALIGFMMCGRILAIIWAAALIQRTGNPGDLVAGLQGLGLPRLVALAIDITITLLGSTDRVHGQRRRATEPNRGGNKFANLALLRQFWGDLGSGKLHFLLNPLQAKLRQAEQRVKVLAPDLEIALARDLALIAGLAALSQTVRFLKLMPGIPFAPGHKSVILLPLYVVAAERTSSRWGATMLGTTQGVVSLTFGEGQFGPFEFCKFLAPGLVVDILWPLAKGRGALAYAGLGLAAAIARFASIVLIGLLIQAPPLFFALLAPMALFHLVFGTASGFVTFHLLAALGKNAILATSSHQYGVPQEGELWLESSEEKASTERTSKPN